MSGGEPEEVTAACFAAAAALRADGADRAAVAAAALESWEGPHRASFDSALAVILERADVLAAAAVALAACVRADAEAGVEASP